MTSPEVEVDDTAGLLRHSAAEVESESRIDRCRRCLKRDWFLVEPVLTAYCLCEFPMFIVAQKYVLDWITINVFSSNSSGSLWPPSYIRSPCDPNITDDELRFNDKVQSLTSLFVVVQSAAWGIPAIFMTIILGAGSDRFGRRQ